MKTLTARYKGTCSGCAGTIEVGARIKGNRNTGWYHADCAPSADPAGDREYWQGRADAERYHADKAIYGEALAESFELDRELAAWNRGEDY